MPSYSWLQFTVGKGDESSPTRGEAHAARSGGDQARASNNPLPVESLRTCFTPAASYPYTHVTCHLPRRLSETQPLPLYWGWPGRLPPAHTTVPDPERKPDVRPSSRAVHQPLRQVDRPYQSWVGTPLKFEFPDVNQRPTVQKACLRMAASGLFCHLSSVPVSIKLILSPSLGTCHPTPNPGPLSVWFYHSSLNAKDIS